MNKNKLSIVVISLDTKLSFLKTIESIINQKNKNFEIIVVDGDSKDGTAEEILKMKNIFSNYLIEKDKGIYDAMNKGINYASGNWTIFLNSGDTLFNSETIDYLLNEDLINYDIVFGHTIVKNNNLEYLMYSNYFNNKCVQMPFCHQSSMVKTNILKSIKFNLNYRLSADFNFFYECLITNKSFFNLNKTISVVESGGVSDKQRQRVFSENIKILKNNGKKNGIYKIYFLKFNQLLKDFIKYFLPKKILNLILKIKYKNKIIK